MLTPTAPRAEQLLLPTPTAPRAEQPLLPAPHGSIHRTAIMNAHSLKQAPNPQPQKGDGLLCMNLIRCPSLENGIPPPEGATCGMSVSQLGTNSGPALVAVTRLSLRSASRMSLSRPSMRVR